MFSILEEKEPKFLSAQLAENEAVCEYTGRIDDTQQPTAFVWCGFDFGFSNEWKSILYVAMKVLYIGGEKIIEHKLDFFQSA